MVRLLPLGLAALIFATASAVSFADGLGKLNPDLLTDPDCTFAGATCGNMNHDCSIQSGSPKCTIAVDADEGEFAWDDPDGDGCGCSY